MPTTSIGDAPATAGTYDNELLDAHYMAGDGRVNENIGLTAVHAHLPLRAQPPGRAHQGSR